MMSGTADIRADTDKEVIKQKLIDWYFEQKYNYNAQQLKPQQLTAEQLLQQAIVWLQNVEAGNISEDVIATHIGHTTQAKRASSIDAYLEILQQAMHCYVRYDGQGQAPAPNDDPLSPILLPDRDQDFWSTSVISSTENLLNHQTKKKMVSGTIKIMIGYQLLEGIGVSTGLIYQVCSMVSQSSLTLSAFIGSLPVYGVCLLVAAWGLYAITQAISWYFFERKLFTDSVASSDQAKQNLTIGEVIRRLPACELSAKSIAIYKQLFDYRLAQQQQDFNKYKTKKIYRKMPKVIATINSFILASPILVFGATGLISLATAGTAIGLGVLAQPIIKWSVVGIAFCAISVIFKYVNYRHSVENIQHKLLERKGYDNEGQLTEKQRIAGELKMANDYQQTASKIRTLKGQQTVLSTLDIEEFKARTEIAFQGTKELREEMKTFYQETVVAQRPSSSFLSSRSVYGMTPEGYSHSRQSPISSFTTLVDKPFGRKRSNSVDSGMSRGSVALVAATSTQTFRPLNKP